MRKIAEVATTTDQKRCNLKLSPAIPQSGQSTSRGTWFSWRNR